MYILILLVLFVVVLYLFKNNNNESKTIDNFGNVSTIIDETSGENKVTKNYSIFNENLFSDVEVFDTVIEGNTIKEIGINNCLTNCNGTCAELGYSGRGICFPDSN
jgi:hypothetical protein